MINRSAESGAAMITGDASKASVDSRYIGVNEDVIATRDGTILLKDLESGGRIRAPTLETRRGRSSRDC